MEEKDKQIIAEISKSSQRLNKMDKVGQTITEITASVALTAVGIGVIVSNINIEDFAVQMALITGGTLLITPLTYFGLKKLQKKSDDRFKREIHNVGQLAVMMKESLNPDYVIGKMTSFFIPVIKEIFDENNVSVLEDELMNINQLVYLINCNYYEKLSLYIPENNREETIRSIIRQISMYLRCRNKNTFDEKDAQKVLDNCIFIPKNLSTEIANEFKKSKVRFLGETMYEIVRNDTEADIDAYKSAKEAEDKDKFTSFDSRNIEHYKQIIEGVSRSDYIKNLSTSDPSSLKWDTEFLMKIMDVITKEHRTELIQRDKSYQNFPLVTSYIYNALAYAVVNNKKEVGKIEMINTFKNWDYIPFDMKLDVLEQIFEEEELDYKEHPFKNMKVKTKNRNNKIIAFRPKE